MPSRPPEHHSSLFGQQQYWPWLVGASSEFTCVWAPALNSELWRQNSCADRVLEWRYGALIPLASLLCTEHNRKDSDFALMSVREPLPGSWQCVGGGWEWRFLEYEPLGTGPAAAETLIKMQPPHSTSSADTIFYPFNEAVLVLGDRFRSIPA